MFTKFVDQFGDSRFEGSDDCGERTDSGLSKCFKHCVVLSKTFNDGRGTACRALVRRTGAKRKSDNNDS